MIVSAWRHTLIVLKTTKVDDHDCLCMMLDFNSLETKKQMTMVVFAWRQTLIVLKTFYYNVNTLSKEQTSKPIRATYIFLKKNNVTTGEGKHANRISHNHQWDLGHLHFISKRALEETLVPIEIEENRSKCIKSHTGERFILAPNHRHVMILTL